MGRAALLADFPLSEAGSTPARLTESARASIMPLLASVAPELLDALVDRATVVLEHEALSRHIAAFHEVAYLLEAKAELFIVSDKVGRDAKKTSQLAYGESILHVPLVSREGKGRPYERPLCFTIRLP
jgi:hypothetical protein